MSTNAGSDAKTNAGSDASALAGEGPMLRVTTYGRGLGSIEESILRAAEGGRAVLINTDDGPDGTADGPGTESDVRAAAIAEWAEVMSREHGLTWQRVGRDVLFQRVIKIP